MTDYTVIENNEATLQVCTTVLGMLERNVTVIASAEDISATSKLSTSIFGKVFNVYSVFPYRWCRLSVHQ